jgi:hypothetical protein
VRSVTQAHLRPDGETIGLAAERCGTQRGSELSLPERALYRWILRRFAAGSALTSSDIDQAAGEQGVVPEPALRRMEEGDLIQRLADGTIWCAYPFSAQPTGHTVEVEGRQPPVHAMCAIDALGIPFMLHCTGVVRSTDPTSGRDVVISIDQAGNLRSDPAHPVALVGRTECVEPLASSCCPLVNLFGTRQLAVRFLHGRPDLRGAVLSLADAVAVARAVFEGVLDQD